MIINEVAVAASGKTVKVDGLFWEWKYTQDYFIYYAASAELYCTFVLPYNEEFNLSNGFYVDSIPVNY